ncbi:TorF family putative porin [Sphingosinicella terrae]|uniref:TorF family putative porin n=1 Tax=Sphingosinicella terrae TaxID=2172047 RepID=UPI000E0DADC8|nr:TorF family putative porin [Sphingosinicella terrae]
MRPSPFILLACVAVAAVPTPGRAAEGSSLTLSYEATLVSDYRFRGLSLTDRGPAAQGGLSVAHASGLYAGLWSSTIQEPGEETDLEIDLSGGYAAELGAVGLDARATWYVYPSDPALDYVEAGLVLSSTFGPASPSVGVDYVPAQGVTRDEAGRAHDNLYAYAAIDYALGGTPITLHGRVGRETGAFDLDDRGGKWDWEAGARLDAGGLEFALSYVDSDARYPDPRGRNPAGAAVVASITLAR